jgi:ATP-dependent Clp protease ATP-binding subunit ClpC
VNMELAKVSKRLTEKGLKLVVSDEAKDFLIEKGSSLEFGARPLRRAIEQHLEDMLAEELLKGTFHGSDTITVKVSEETGEKKLGFETSKNNTESQAPAVVAGQA